MLSIKLNHLGESFWAHQFGSMILDWLCLRKSLERRPLLQLPVEGVFERTCLKAGQRSFDSDTAVKAFGRVPITKL
jgi:hypothetical protein